MKKNILLLMVAVLLFACGDDGGHPGVSNLDKDWYVIVDNPDDAVDHERFLIYDRYGISVYYNDTIGSEIRRDRWGNDYRYYELLQIFYAPGSEKPEGSFTLVEDKDELLPVLTYARERVFDRVPEAMRSVPVLFVADLTCAEFADADFYRGFSSLVVKSIPDFGTLTDEERRELDVRLLGGLFYGVLVTQEAGWLASDFYPVSRGLNPDEYTDVYSSVGTWGGQTVYNACYGTDLELTLNALGFLQPLEESDLPEEEWYTPTPTLDVMSYAGLLFRNTAAEVERQYASYPVVLQKYRMMREKAESYGFTFE